MTARLGRGRSGRAAPPVRVVHFGPGAFHRAHQAWYTAGAGPDWGIAAVTRSTATRRSLGSQDGLYTVLTRRPEGDDATVVGSIASVLDLADPRLDVTLADPAVTVVTLTLTEAGYLPGSTVLARLAAGLAARHRAGAGPIAVVSCDNLAGNGRVTAAGVLAATRSAVAAGHAEGDLPAWVRASCAFPDTVVDRITPAAGPGDLADAARLTGWEDCAAVVTEAWTEWIIEDAWGAVTIRPPWERAGARLVADVGPWARRKLRLLNAGHSLLAYLGPRRGHRWVHEAVADQEVHAQLLGLWSEARRALPRGPTTDLDAYCAAVVGRWANPRLPHALAQIAAGGRLKLRERIVPTLLAGRRAGTEPTVAALVVAAWVAQLRSGADPDPLAADLAAATVRAAAQRALAALDADLVDDDWVVGAVADALARVEG